MQVNKYDPLIPKFTTMYALAITLWCILHITTGGYVTVIAIIGILSFVLYPVFYILLTKVGFKLRHIPFRNYRQRMKNIHVMWPLRLLRAVVLTGILYLWFVPVMYTPERFHEAVYNMELDEQMEKTIYVAEPLMPAPKKDTLQRSGELIGVLYGTAGRIAEFQDIEDEETAALEMEKYIEELRPILEETERLFEVVPKRMIILYALIVIDGILHGVIQYIGYKKCVKKSVKGVIINGNARTKSS